MLVSAFVSLVVTLITLYVIQPIQGQKQLIGEIAYATRFYRAATSKVRAEWRDPQAAKAKAEEATQALLMLAARLAASPATLPAIRMGDSQAAQRYRLEVIKVLDLPKD